MSEAKEATDFGAGVERTSTDKQREKETRRRANEEKKQKKEAEERERAQRASERATQFQQYATSIDRGHNERACKGVSSWPHPGQPSRYVNVTFVRLPLSKVPAFGTTLNTATGEDVKFLPTEHSTLLLEAGCSAEKTRRLVEWLDGELAGDSKKRVLFVSCRKTHADDIFKTLHNENKIDGCKNYLDATKSDAGSKTAYLKDAMISIVSLQSLHTVDLDQKFHVVVCDEFRSMLSCVGGKTLKQPAAQLDLLKKATTGAKLVCIDADVSADGAVEEGLRLIAPSADVLHVQLQQPALRRTMSLAFGPRTGGPFMERLELWLLRVRCVSDEWVTKRQKRMERASLELWRLERSWRRERAESPETLEERDRSRRRLWKLKGFADTRRACMLSWLSLVREKLWAKDMVDDEEIKRERLRLSEQTRAARYDRQRVLIICATAKDASDYAHLCDKFFVPYHYYSGSSSDSEKRTHFQNTTQHWFQAAVILTTTTMTVAVNVRIHFSVVFLQLTKSKDAGRLRDLLQAAVRVGRDDDDPLEDERIFTSVPGDVPDLTQFEPQTQQKRFHGVLYGVKGTQQTNLDCDRNAEKIYDKVSGSSFYPTEELSEPLLRIIAWNNLEGQDNMGYAFVYKLIELCKLKTRDWRVELMPPHLSEEEKLEKKTLEETPPPTWAAMDDEEDKDVAKMSMKEKFEWLQAHLWKRAKAAVDEDLRNSTVRPDDEQQSEVLISKKLKQVEDEFIREQETCRFSREARPDKNAREICKEKVYQVIEFFGCFPKSLGPKKFSKLANGGIEKLVQRAITSTMPLAEQCKVYERQRRQSSDRSTHPVVETPAHTQTELLTRLAEKLDVPLDRLLRATIYTDADSWVALNNRERCKELTNADKASIEEISKIARNLGAMVTSQMSLHKIVERVLCDVLKLTPSKPEEKKEQFDNKRVYQLRRWEILDEWKGIIPMLCLPLIQPDGVLRRDVKQADWLETFERLQCHAEEHRRQDDGMDVDEEELFDADPAATDPSDRHQPTIHSFVSNARRYDPYRKTEKYDGQSISAALDDLQGDESARRACSKEVFDALSVQRRRLWPYPEACGGVAVAFVEIDARGDIINVLLNNKSYNEASRYCFIQGPPRANENVRETAARVFSDQCACLFSANKGRLDRERVQLESGKATLTECWVADVKTLLFVASFVEGAPPGCQGFDWISRSDLLDQRWARANLHSFCSLHVKAMEPWLRRIVGSNKMLLPPDELRACSESVRKLEGWYHDLERSDGMHALFQKIQTSAKTARHGADGRVHFETTYVHKGIGIRGRRYAESDAFQRRHGDRFERERSCTLQGMYSDARSVVVGLTAYDVDIENAHARLLKSLATQLGNEDMIPSVFDYVANRGRWLDEIGSLHGVEREVAKKLPSVIVSFGSYDTWLKDNDLPPPRSRYSKVLQMHKELRGFRKLLIGCTRENVSPHPKFKGMVDLERGRLTSEGKKDAHAVDASLMSRILQTCEDDVISMVDRHFFDLGWDTLAIVFDGIIVEPAEGSTDHVDLKHAIVEAERACILSGWDIKLVDKPLHREPGEEYLPTRSAKAARSSMQAFRAWKEQLAGA